MSDDDPLKYLYERQQGSKDKLPLNLGSYLREAGFENIHCQFMKVPIGQWAKDRAMRIVGQYPKMAVVELLPAYAGRPPSTSSIK
ncbi:hypothetical protein E4U40_006662 [Claviceps sp. LM458 group G5]|nr:hypothetical protein E4U40_006662 [Claviceps sp. LM458 group G5]